MNRMSISFAKFAMKTMITKRRLLCVYNAAIHFVQIVSQSTKINAPIVKRITLRFQVKTTRC